MFLGEEALKSLLICRDQTVLLALTRLLAKSSGKFSEVKYTFIELCNSLSEKLIYRTCKYQKPFDKLKQSIS